MTDKMQTAEAQRLAAGVGHHSFTPNKAQPLNPAIEKALQEAITKTIADREHFIAQYLAETGASIAETKLVAQTSADGQRVEFWCEPKEGKKKLMKDMNSQECYEEMTKGYDATKWED
jgi:hypothetical protein